MDASEHFAAFDAICIRERTIADLTAERDKLIADLAEENAPVPDPTHLSLTPWERVILEVKLLRGEDLAEEWRARGRT